MSEMRWPMEPVLTPLLAFIDTPHRKIFVKDETKQHSGAFKYRGSFAVLTSPDMAGFSGELVTASTGNHASGLSTAAQAYGVPALIFVPSGTPRAKQMRILNAGGRIRLVEGSYEDAVLLAIAYAKETGAVYIPSFDDPRVIAGNAEVFHEITEQMGHIPERLYIPVGGGGLLSGVVSASDPTRTLVIACEYDVFARVDGICRGQFEQIDIGTPELPPSIEGIAVKGLGAHPLQILQNAPNLETRQISKEQMEQAHVLLWKTLGIRAELGSCVSVAAAIQDMHHKQSKDFVACCVITGGNIDEAVHQDIMGRLS